MLDDVEMLLLSTSGSMEVPLEYVEYLMCLHFHCLPKDLDKLPAETYNLFKSFMILERKTGKIRADIAHAKRH